MRTGYTPSSTADATTPGSSPGSGSRSPAVRSASRFCCAQAVSGEPVARLMLPSARRVTISVGAGAASPPLSVSIATPAAGAWRLQSPGHSMARGLAVVVARPPGRRTSTGVSSAGLTQARPARICRTGSLSPSSSPLSGSIASSMNVTLAPVSKRTTPPPSRSIVTEPSVGAWTTSPATTASPAASGRVRAPERTVVPASTLAVWPSSTVAGPPPSSPRASSAPDASATTATARPANSSWPARSRPRERGAVRSPASGDGGGGGGGGDDGAGDTVGGAGDAAAGAGDAAGGAGDTAGRGGGLDRTKGTCGPPSAA